MAVFKVWEVGCNKTDAQWIDALSVEDAAEQWGRDADVQSGVFAIGHGQQQVLLNVMPEATGITEQIRVSGDVYFQYFTVPVESK